VPTSNVTAGVAPQRNGAVRQLISKQACVVNKCHAGQRSVAALDLLDRLPVGPFPSAAHKVCAGGRRWTDG